MKFLGTTTDVTACECCGKTNLKKTVALSDDIGCIVYYGTDCAGKVIYGKKTSGNTKLVNNQASAVDYAKAVMEKWGIEKASIAVWNRYGYSTQVTDGKLKISDFAVI